MTFAPIDLFCTIETVQTAATGQLDRLTVNNAGAGGRRCPLLLGGFLSTKYEVFAKSRPASIVESNGIPSAKAEIHGAASAKRIHFERYRESHSALRVSRLFADARPASLPGEIAGQSAIAHPANPLRKGVVSFAFHLAHLVLSVSVTAKGELELPS